MEQVEEAKQLLSLLSYTEEDCNGADKSNEGAICEGMATQTVEKQQTALFLPETRTIVPRSGRAGLASSHREIQHAEAPKRLIHIDGTENITVDTTNSILLEKKSDHEKPTQWVLPQDITKAFADGSIKRWREVEARRRSDTEKELLEYHGDHWDVNGRNAALPIIGVYKPLPIRRGKAGYWVTLLDGDRKGCSIPVYGYMLDTGRCNAMPPTITREEAQEITWSNAEWLCRCAQCGRELLPKDFAIDGNGRISMRCHGCTAMNKTADAMLGKIRFLTVEQLEFLDKYDLLVLNQWRRWLLPDSKRIRVLLGDSEIRSRIRKGTFNSNKYPEGYNPRPQTWERATQYVDSCLEDIAGNI